MPAQKVPTISSALFSVILDKGSTVKGAAKHRLPLSHVINTLREVDFLIRELGKKIQRDRGVPAPDGDFGIELLASESGLAFQAGSIGTQALITKDVANGIDTLAQIIGTTNSVNVKRKKDVVSIGEYGEPVVRRLAKIAPIQEEDKTELTFSLAVQGKPTEVARFGKDGIKMIRRLTTADFSIESLTLYGKLSRLVDRSRTDEQDDIWGELQEDSGNTWRMKFNPADLKTVRNLFTKQVTVTGDASYYKAISPRLDVKQITEDKPRNYIAAFNAFGRKYRDVFGERTAEDILADIRG
jgi:hypothetical protein